MRIELPKLHDGQATVYEARKRFNVIQCGRRWGKTVFGEVVAALPAIEGHPVGWCSPTYKYMLEVWNDMNRHLAPMTVRSDKTEKRIELHGGGLVEFWTMDSKDPGRSRKYKRLVLDECGVVRNLVATWQASLRPTLTDLIGDAFFLGTPKGRREFHTLYAKGESGAPGWASFRSPTSTNPVIPKSEIEDARRDLLPHVFKQEYEGIPADDGGNPFGMDHIAACTQPMSPDDPVVWGVDLAKSHDWTVAIALDDKGRVCRFKRWQAPWLVTTRELVALIGSTPAMVDATGVGDPIVEMLLRECPAVEGVKFTTQKKQQLMLGLAAALQSGAVGFPDGTIRSELEMFEYDYRPGGHVAYSAPAGLHDDCVCALALAVSAFTGSVRRGVVYVGTAETEDDPNDDRLWRAA